MTLCFGLLLRLGHACVAVCCVAAVIGSVAVASAQPGAVDRRDEEARSLFEAGRTAYEDGRFADALEHFKSAYALSNRSALLFNIGSAADRLRRDREAAEAFEQYLRQMPDAANRSEVEARIEVLRNHLRAADRAATLGEQSERDLSPPPPGEGGAGALPWIVVGGSAALVVGGGVLLAVGLSDISDVEDAEVGTSWNQVQSADDRAPTLTALGIALGGVGLVGVVVGVLWLGSQDEPAAMISVGPNAVQLRGRF